jgi:tyrosine-protein kinase Etk/Wzc
MEWLPARTLSQASGTETMPSAFTSHNGRKLPHHTTPQGNGAGRGNGARPSNGSAAHELPLASSLDWRRFIVAVWRYRWVVLLVAVLGSASGFALAHQIKPQYKAQTTIWIEPSDSRANEQAPVQTGQLLQAGAAWVELLRSYRVLDEVVGDLRLYLRAASPQEANLLAQFQLDDGLAAGHYRLAVDPDGRRFQLIAAGDKLVHEGAIDDLSGPLTGQETLERVSALGGDIEFSVESLRDVARSLGERINTEIDSEHTFLNLSLTGEDPVQISEVLNAVSQRYVQVVHDLKRERLLESTRILNEQLSQAHQQLLEAEGELESFRVRTITLPAQRATPVAPGVESTRESAFSNYSSLLIEREQLRRDRWSIDRVLRNASESGPSIEGLEIIPSVRASSDLVLAMGELTSKRSELRSQLNRYTEEHQAVRDLRSEIQSLETSTVPRLAADLSRTLADREVILESMIVAAADELRRTPMRAIGEARLERRVAIAANLFNTLQARRDEAHLAAESSIPDVRVMDAAFPPQQPINESQEEQFILMALMASLCIAVGVGILLDFLDTRLSYPQQVSDGLGVPVIGSVPHVNNGSRGLSALKAAQVVEAFRVIRLNVAHAHGTAGPVVLSVTSPEPEDGKSFVLANLGMAFSGMGYRTLIIDADVRRGSQHRLLGGGRKPGLTDYLAGNAPLEKVVRSTSHRALSRIASGTRRQDGPELLQSRAMTYLLAQMRKEYDVILVDTPPLAACADPLALGTLTRNMVLVVRTGTTNRSATEWRLDSLARLPVRLLGAILNDVPHVGVYRYHRKAYASLYLPDEAKRALPGKRIQRSIDLREGASVDDSQTEPPKVDPRTEVDRVERVTLPDGNGNGRNNGNGTHSGNRKRNGNGSELPIAAEIQVDFNASRYSRLDELLDLEIESVIQEVEPVEVADLEITDFEILDWQVDSNEEGNSHGNGNGSGNGNGNGEGRLGRAIDEDLAGVDARIESFREHQRRNHVRLWK